MEQKLKQLFDYQKFHHNSRLDAMLAAAETRYEHVLADTDLEWVSAAGTAENLPWRDTGMGVVKE